LCVCACTSSSGNLTNMLKITTTSCVTARNQEVMFRNI
jgi:hypothetical protein